MSEMTPDLRTIGGLLAHQAEAFPSRPFVTFAGRTISYGQLDQLASEAANCLAGLGVRHGDRVGIALGNSPEFLTVTFGALRLGAVLVPLNLEYRSAQVAYVLGDAEATVLVTSRRFLEQHCEVIRAAELSVVVTDTDLQSPEVGLLEWRALVEASDPVEQLPEVHPSDVMAIIYTSGTTGEPKGVQLCHEHELTLADNVARSVGLRADDCFYNFYPLHHNTGLGIITFGVLVAGASMLLRERFSKSAFWGDVVGHGCTVFYGMGPIVEILLKDESGIEEAQGHRLRACFGIAIDEGQAHRFKARFGLNFVSGYGSTEVNMVAIGPMLDGHRGTAGKILDDFEVAILEGDDRPVPLGRVGEIAVRPRRPFVTSLGYWRKPEQTIRAWRNLWIHTGDAGWLDEDGNIYFLDRINDVIRHRGNSVSSMEVESVLLRYPLVEEAAVIPVPSGLGKFDQDVCALVVPLKRDAYLDPAELVEFCKDALPDYAVPRYVELLEELPKTATGKVQKALLRARSGGHNRWDRTASPGTTGVSEGRRGVE